MPFDVVHEVCEFMEGFPGPWCIAGGWAIDCFLERTTRRHRDVAVALLRRDRERLREWLDGWDLTVLQGGMRTPWLPGQNLPPPVHEIHARRSSGAPAHLVFLLHPSAHGRWIFRRNAMVAAPLQRLSGRNGDGIPYLAPEIVLLFKAKRHTDVEEYDFRVVLPSLTGQARIWLREALRVAHPDHPWLEVLRSPLLPPLPPIPPP